MEHKDLSKEQLVEQIRALQERIDSLEKTAATHGQTRDSLSAILEKNADGIVIVDTDGTVLYTNPAARKLFGKRKEDFLGYPFGFPLRTDKAEDSIIIRKGDRLREAELRVVQVHWQKRPAFQLSIRDVTEHKQAEEALLESEKRYRLLTQQSLTGIYIHVGGLVKFVNNRFAKMLGYVPEEIVGHTYWDFVHPGDREMVKDISLARFRGEAAPTEYEFRHLSKDGKTVWVHNLPTIIQFQGQTATMGNLAQINDRKQVEQDLQEAVKREKSLIDELKRDKEQLHKGLDALEQAESIAQLGYFERNWQTGEGYWSRGFFKLFGISGTSNAPTHDAFMELVYQEDRVDVEKHIKDSLLNKIDMDIEFRGQKSNGDIIRIHGIAQNNFDDDGHPLATRGIFRDITDQKIAENERKQLEAQLQQAQKMEAIGTLAGGIAHDFNNILSAVIGYAELLVMKIPKESDLQADLNEVYKAGNRAKELVKQILTFSRQKESERIRVQPSFIFKEAIKMLRSSIPAGIEIRQNIDPNSGTILADPTQLHQVIMNLCTNAYHAMSEESGILEISLATVEIDSSEEWFSKDLHPGSYVKLTVSDTGSGITPQVRDQIFEPYFTTKEIGEGTGLGLSTVHGIVKTYGGAIAVESEPGVGSTFHVYFPRLKKEAAPVQEMEDMVPGGHERVLLVDDESSIRTLAKRILEQKGYKVKVVSDGVEALELFRAGPDEFDLVLTDMGMPKMNGLQLSSVHP